ncbi:hypothetical protein ACFWEB_36675 [Streptomyces parvus]|uniref:hypothetical protein n=1 Tax=Streptomyces parvus TaxID=66428 RepID=UPI00364E8983
MEQRITTGAHYAWRRLLNRYGEQPPGPAPEGMHCVTGGRRVAAILRACSYAPRL